MEPILIPQDLINHIVDKLKSDKQALANGSLVSRSFRDPCRRHLFAHLELDSRRMKRIKAFHRILALNPSLAYNVRRLHLIIYEASNDRALPLVLQALNNLRSISWQVPQAEPLSWAVFRPSLKNAVTERLQSPGLAQLDISHVIGFPLSLLAVCTDLKKLTLSDVFPPPFIYHEVVLETKAKPKARLQSLSVSSTLNADCSLASVFTHLLTSVELSHLRQFSVGSLRKDDEISECQRVIESCADSLEDLTVVAKFISPIPQISFNLSSATSLRRLSIKIPQNTRVLEWLQTALCSVNGSLEHIKLSMFDQMVAEGNETVLARLVEIDETLADPKFGRLQSVSLAFDSWMSRPIFGSLFPGQCAPKLASKGILYIYWNNRRLFTGKNLA